MTATNRSIRQQEADRTGREARVEAVTRDLLADVDYYSSTTNHEIGRQER